MWHGATLGFLCNILVPKPGFSWKKIRCAGCKRHIKRIEVLPDGIVIGCKACSPNYKKILITVSAGV